MTTDFVLVVGNPVIGLIFIGPFAKASEAVAWAEEQDYSTEWWVRPLLAVTTQKAQVDEEDEQ